MLGGIPTAKGADFVVVVEGPVDKYKVGDHSVFSFGKSLSKDQIRLLQAYWKRVILIRDPEIDPNSPSFKGMVDRMHPLRVDDLALSGGRDAGATPTSEIWEQIADHVGDPSFRKYGEKN